MSASPSDGTYINYKVYNHYYNTAYRYEPGDNIKVKKEKPIPKKTKIHIFDIKDLDLKEG